MSKSTATVETLTAEVRVLTVGNKQVTKSVAQQLDVIPLEGLEPFGRVKLEKNQPYETLIGKNKTDGALCIAKIREPSRVWLDCEGVACPIVFGDDSTFVDGVRCDLVNVKYGEVPSNFVDIWGTEEFWIEPERLNEFTEYVEREVREYKSELSKFKEIQEMPLIVLAGLR